MNFSNRRMGAVSGLGLEVAYSGDFSELVEENSELHREAEIIFNAVILDPVTVKGKARFLERSLA